MRAFFAIFLISVLLFQVVTFGNVFAAEQLGGSFVVEKSNTLEKNEPYDSYRTTLHWKLLEDGLPVKYLINVWFDDGSGKQDYEQTTVDSQGNLQVEHTLLPAGETFVFSLSYYPPNAAYGDDIPISNSEIIIETPGREDGCTIDPFDYGEIQVVDKWGYIVEIPYGGYELHWGWTLKGIPHEVLDFTPSVSGIGVNYKTSGPFDSSPYGTWARTTDDGKLEQVWLIEELGNYTFEIDDFETFGAYCGDGDIIIINSDGNSENTIEIGDNDPENTSDVANDDTVSDVLDPPEDSTSADLSVSSTFGKPLSTEKTGQKFLYQINVKNNGPNSALSAVLKGTIPSEFIVHDVKIQNPITGDTCNTQNSLECKFGTILVGKTKVVVITASAKPVSKVTPTQSTFSVTSLTSDPNTNNNKLVLEIPTILAKITNVSLYAHTSVKETKGGSDVIYEIHVTNNGPDIAEQVIVKSKFPDLLKGAEIISKSKDFQCTKFNPLECYIENLKPGDSVKFDLKVFTKTVFQDTFLTSTFFVETQDSDPFPDDNKKILEHPKLTVQNVADVYVTQCSDAWSIKDRKCTPTPRVVKPDEPFLYEYYIINSGPNPATNVVLVNTLPSGVVLSSSTVSSLKYLISQGNCVGEGIVSCDVGTIEAGKNVKLEFFVKAKPVSSPTSLLNSATVSTSSNDPNLLNNRLIYEIPIVSTTPVVDVTLRIFNMNESEVFLVQNLGNAVAKDVVLTINFPFKAKSFYTYDETSTKYSVSTTKCSGDTTVICKFGDISPKIYGTSVAISSYDYENYDGVAFSAIVSTSSVDVVASNNKASSKIHVPDDLKELVKRETSLYTKTEKYSLPKFKETKQVSVSGTVPEYKRGEPVVLVVTKPDGTTEEFAIGASKSGEYDLKYQLTHDMKQGEYKITVKYAQQEIDSFSIQLVSDMVPSWIKNNAGWWAKGTIDDDSFIQGIQFLIKENILLISGEPKSQQTTNEIPDWVRNNAGWWADGAISESDFVNGIKFLIENGIVNIP